MIPTNTYHIKINVFRNKIIEFDKKIKNLNKYNIEDLNNDGYVIVKAEAIFNEKIHDVYINMNHDFIDYPIVSLKDYKTQLYKFQKERVINHIIQIRNSKLDIILKDA